MILPNHSIVNDNLLTNVNLLKSAARGYISYYQGNMCSAVIRYMGTKVDSDRSIYFSRMVDIQEATYVELYNNNNHNDAIYSNSNSASLFVFSDGTYGSTVNNTGKLLCRDILVNEFIGAYQQERKINYKCKRFIVHEFYKNDITIDNLYKHSCKYYAIIKEILSRPKQCCFVFIREVVGSGALLFTCILESLGYELYYGQDISTISKRRRYTICVGENEISPNNKDRIAGFNSSNNKYGEYVQVMLGSSVMGESISLLNVRHFHSASPHWNDSVIEQAIRRVIRAGSHDGLKEEEKTVDIFLHAAYISSDVITVDMRKIHITQQKELGLVPLRNNLREISIENIIKSYNINKLNLDCSTYINYINNKILSRYISIICTVITKPTHLDNISYILSLPQLLVRYVISKCILHNITVRDYYGRIGYVREVNGIVSISRNIASYSIDLEIPKLLYLEHIEVVDDYDPHEFIDKLDSSNTFTIICEINKLSWNRRLSVIERSIELSNNICSIFSLYIVNMSHLYQYRKPTKGSYKSLLVGIRPRGLARFLSCGYWNYMPVDDEVNVVSIYSSRLHEIRSTKSINGRLYTLSTTDLVMRMILIDDMYIDNRLYKRGRNIKALSNDDYNKCCLDVVGYSVPVDMLMSILIDRGYMIYV